MNDPKNKLYQSTLFRSDVLNLLFMKSADEDGNQSNNTFKSKAIAMYFSLTLDWI